MKKLSLLLLVSISVLIFNDCKKSDVVVPADQQEAATLKSASLNGKYIVVLKEDAGISSSANAQSRIEQVKAKAYGLLKKNTISENVEEVYGTALQGFAVKMAPGQAKKLAQDGGVNYIEPDQVVALSPIEIQKGKPGGGGGGTTQPAQTTPWGIGLVHGGTTTSTHTAWIIDTGVDYTHPDLTNLDQSRSRTYVSRTKTANDDNGHGSHVAGIIAAMNNSIGVVGVAPGSPIVAVKVLDRNGSGSYSVVIKGVDYVAANCRVGDVANMSLGGPISTALDQAVYSASMPHDNNIGKSQFVMFSIAAGNSSDYAINYSPADVNGPNIYTISAMDSKKVFAYFSNYGNPPVDYCEPGVSILSCYKGGGYATMSGTSMAAPHMAGILLLSSPNTEGYVTGEPNGEADPIGVH